MLRTARDDAGHPADFDDSPDNDVYPGLMLRPRLDVAMQRLGPAAALQLCETADLADLSERISLTHYLANPAQLILTLDQFGDLLRSFISKLEECREHVVSTGLWPMTL